MFGTEFCDNYFSDGIGRKPDVDHILTKFWCAAERLSGYHDLGSFQRCVGKENSHYYLMNYTL